MARHAIDKARVRGQLEPRREPYWGAPLKRGLFLGYRKLDKGGTWIARYRDDDGRQRYNSIGHADRITHEQAIKAAQEWCKDVQHGVDATEVRTVADACREYVEDRRREKGDANADDAAARFRRTVYSHSIGKVKLAKLRAHQIKAWRADLTMAKASANRTLTTLKAALNYAVAQRYMDAGKAIEWTRVKPYEAHSRRKLYLDRNERRALLDHMEPDARAFARAMCLLPLRPGALAALTVADFNARTHSLTVGKDKAGDDRTILLPAETVGFFKEQARGKLPAAPLISVGGTHWDKEKWKGPIKRAARAAGLPDGTCAYTLRHSVITDLVTGGLDLFTVAQVSGTSVAMIERYYGKLQQKRAAEALAGLAI